MRYTIQNEYLKVTVDSKGCEIVSAITAADNREHIWQADPAAWKRHAPVLFPLVGKYRDNSVTYNGRQYHMTQHGFARDMEFAVDVQTATEAWFSLFCRNRSV